MKTLTGILLTVFAAGPALAQLTTIESSNPLPKPITGSNLDKIICERVQRTGSRLEFDKVCMTALQWKNHRQGQREDFEKVQRIVNQEPSH